MSSAFPDLGLWPGTLAGNPLSNSAWYCLNVRDLTGDPETPGENARRFGAHGRRGRIHWDDEQRVDLLFVMTGNNDPDGDPYEDAYAGLETNKDLFRAAYFRAERDSDWCVPATVLKPNDILVGGPAQPHRPIWGDGDFECAPTMTVVLTRGFLLPIEDDD